MLNKISGIEGLNGIHEELEFYDDTNPGDTIVKFFVKSEEMPYLTSVNPDGTVVRKNFIYIRKEKDLGRTILQRRIVDDVSFEEGASKWEIRKIHPGKCLDGTPKSDILRYPDQWNAFMRGTKEEEIGTPLMLLFKNDPTRVEFYKSHHIHSIEQLANQSHGNLELLGMGAHGDAARAKKYLDKAKELAPGIELNSRLAEKESQIQTLSNQVSELTLKLTEILQERAVPAGTHAERKSKSTGLKESLSL